MPAQNEVMILFAGAYGYLDEWPEEKVSEYEQQMLEFMGSKYGDLLGEVKEKGEISDELEEKFKKALDEFKTVYQPDASS